MIPNLSSIFNPGLIKWYHFISLMLLFIRLVLTHQLCKDFFLNLSLAQVPG